MAFPTLRRMPKITFTFADGRETGLSLDGDVFTIGRAEDNDIVLGDARVSSYHAVLKRAHGGDFVVNDLGATNPTRVNGKPTQLQALHHRDTLLFGDVFALYESERGAIVDPRAPRRPAAVNPAETVGSGCFALVVGVLLIGVASALLACIV